MKLFRPFPAIVILLIVVFYLPSCSNDPIEHGIEYTLRVGDGTDSAAASKSYMIIETRLRNFDLDGQYEIVMEGNDIHVRISDGSTFDNERLKTLLESSAGLTF